MNLPDHSVLIRATLGVGTGIIQSVEEYRASPILHRSTVLTRCLRSALHTSNPTMSIGVALLGAGIFAKKGVYVDEIPLRF